MELVGLFENTVICYGSDDDFSSPYIVELNHYKRENQNSKKYHFNRVLTEII
jgi:hypothetical protein